MRKSSEPNAFNVDTRQATSDKRHNTTYARHAQCFAAVCQPLVASGRHCCGSVANSLDNVDRLIVVCHLIYNMLFLN